MIEIHKLTVEREIPEISELTLSVPPGVTYVLLSAGNRVAHHMVNIFSGFETRYMGDVRAEDRDIRGIIDPAASSLVVTDRESDWPHAVRLGHVLGFLRRVTSISEEAFEEFKLKLNLERLRQRRMVDFPEAEKRQLFFAFQCLLETRNFLIHDLGRGMPVDFVLWFKECLRSLKAQEKSILYLSNDVFFAPEIGDVVGFMKRGKLLLELKGAKVRRMDLKELYFRFLSEE